MFVVVPSLSEVGLFTVVVAPAAVGVTVAETKTTRWYSAGYL